MSQIIVSIIIFLAAFSNQSSAVLLQQHEQLYNIIDPDSDIDHRNSINLEILRDNFNKFENHFIKLFPYNTSLSELYHRLNVLSEIIGFDRYELKEEKISIISTLDSLTYTVNLIQHTVQSLFSRITSIDFANSFNTLFAYLSDTNNYIHNLVATLNTSIIMEDINKSFKELGEKIDLIDSRSHSSGSSFDIINRSASDENLAACLQNNKLLITSARREIPEMNDDVVKQLLELLINSNNVNDVANPYITKLEIDLNNNKNKGIMDVISESLPAAIDFVNDKFNTTKGYVNKGLDVGRDMASGLMRDSPGERKPFSFRNLTSMTPSSMSYSPVNLNINNNFNETLCKTILNIDCPRCEECDVKSDSTDSEIEEFENVSSTSNKVGFNYMTIVFDNFTIYKYMYDAQTPKIKYLYNLIVQQGKRLIMYNDSMNQLKVPDAYYRRRGKRETVKVFPSRTYGNVVTAVDKYNQVVPVSRSYNQNIPIKFEDKYNYKITNFTTYMDFSNISLEILREDKSLAYVFKTSIGSFDTCAKFMKYILQSLSPNNVLQMLLDLDYFTVIDEDHLLKILDLLFSTDNRKAYFSRFVESFYFAGPDDLSLDDGIEKYKFLKPMLINTDSTFRKYISTHLDLEHSSLAEGATIINKLFPIYEDNLPSFLNLIKPFLNNYNITIDN